MTTDEVLQVCRRLLEEVDTSTSILTDEEILAAVSDQRDLLELELVPGFDVFTVGYDQADPETYGIVDEADLTLELGVILAYRAAAQLLNQAYLSAVRRGVIGVSWTSGLEAESTLQAGRDYQGSIKSVRDKAVELILIKRRLEAGTRIQ